MSETWECTVKIDRFTIVFPIKCSALVAPHKEVDGLLRELWDQLDVAIEDDGYSAEFKLVDE